MNARLILVAIMAVLAAASGCAPDAQEPAESPRAVPVTEVPDTPASTPAATGDEPADPETRESLNPAQPVTEPRAITETVIHTPIPSFPGLVPPAAGQDVVQRATYDLAQRLSIDPAEIDLVTLVTDEYAWDELLCPNDKEAARPIPVMVVGQEIVLSVQGTEYLYRAQAKTLAFCGER